jgi:hypothetical protein
MDEQSRFQRWRQERKCSRVGKVTPRIFPFRESRDRADAILKGASQRACKRLKVRVVQSRLVSRELMPFGQRLQDLSGPLGISRRSVIRYEQNHHRRPFVRPSAAAQAARTQTSTASILISLL